MHTSVGLLALAGFLVAPSPASDTLWMTDYHAAQRKGSELKKPLAVVIAAGKNGFDRLLKEGNLGNEARSTLATNYVCVYVDSSKEENKKLVKAFEMKSEVGLVISDRRGEYEAFRHEGQLTAEELARQLRRHAPVESFVFYSEQVIPANGPNPSSFQPVQRANYYSSEPFRTIQPYTYPAGRAVQNC